MEIALCASFVPKKRLPRFSICQLSCSLNGVQMKHRVYSGFRTNYGIIESHHLWLLYYSNYTLNDGRISSEIDANGFCQLKIKIDSQSFEVKKIGVRLVYRQDIEDPYQAMAHCINNSSMLLWGPGCSPSWSWRFSLRKYQKSAKQWWGWRAWTFLSRERYNIEEPQTKRIKDSRD